jgi:transcriptional regulator with XRE-family HTH domain
MTDASDKHLTGLRLRAAREALGYNETRGRTQAAFYRVFGLSKARGNNWERGVSYVHPSFLKELHERFGITADWLILGRPDGLPARHAAKVISNFRKIKEGNSADC